MTTIRCVYNLTPDAREMLRLIAAYKRQSMSDALDDAIRATYDAHESAIKSAPAYLQPKGRGVVESLPPDYKRPVEDEGSDPELDEILSGAEEC